MALLAAKLIVVTARPETIAAAIGVDVAALRAAVERRKDKGLSQRGGPGVRRGPNRAVPKGMKWCNRCQRHRPITQFGPNRAASDGHQNYCRPCAREYNRAQAQKTRMRDRALRLVRDDTTEAVSG